MQTVWLSDGNEVSSSSIEKNARYQLSPTDYINRRISPEMQIKKREGKDPNAPIINVVMSLGESTLMSGNERTSACLEK